MFSYKCLQVNTFAVFAISNFFFCNSVLLGYIIIVKKNSREISVSTLSLVFVRYIMKYERPKSGGLTRLSMLKYIMEKDADPVRKLDTPRDQSAVQ